MELHQPQVRVTVGSMDATVDPELADLIREIWIAGWETTRSCQDHAGTGQVWIEFFRRRGIQGFLNAVAAHDREVGSLWSRANAWGFGDRVITPTAMVNGGWEYHVSIQDAAHDNATGKFIDSEPTFWISISVLFPRSDLSVVTERMREFNAKHTGTPA